MSDGDEFHRQKRATKGPGEPRMGVEIEWMNANS